MDIAVTGTRYGMTDAQRGALGAVLTFDIPNNAPFFLFRHGSCKGVDVETARLVRYIHGPGVKIIAHPGPDSLDEWVEDSGVDDEVLPGKTHFARNRDIVRLVDLLIGFPGIDRLTPFEGTFYAISFAVKEGKPVKIIWPNGTVEDRRMT